MDIMVSLLNFNCQALADLLFNLEPGVVPTYSSQSGKKRMVMIMLLICLCTLKMDRVIVLGSNFYYSL